LKEDRYNTTAAHLAIYSKDPPAVLKVLFESGANMNPKTADGETLLDVATRLGKRDTVAEFLKSYTALGIVG
jgi:ankyrin repeat protein